MFRQGRRVPALAVLALVVAVVTATVQFATTATAQAFSVLVFSKTAGFRHDSIPAGIVVVAFVIVYQQLENHFLQPVIYGRTVQLSALAVIVSVT